MARRLSAGTAIGLALSGYAAGALAQQVSPILQSPDFLGLGSLNTPPPDPQSGVVTAIGVRAGLTYTDNLVLAPNGQEVSGTIGEISPYIVARANRPRLQGNLYYSLRNFYSFRDSDWDSARHHLRAMGRTEFGDSNFWLAGRASVFDVNSSPFLASSFDPSASPANRSRYQLYDLSPHYLGRTTNTNYMVLYSLTHIDPGQATKVTSHAGMGRIRSTFDQSRIGWNAMAQSRRFEYDSGYSYGRSDVQLGLQNEFTPSLMAGITANYSASDRLRSASGSTSGWGPGAYFGWRPTERSHVFGQTVQNYYGNTSSLRMSHRAAGWVFGATYRRGVVDYAQSIVQSYDPSLGTGGAGIDPYDPGAITTPGGLPDTSAGQQTDTATDQQPAIADYGAPLTSGIVASPLVWTRTFQLTAGISGLRDSLTFAVFQTDRHAAASNGAPPTISGNLAGLQQRGISARFQHKLTPVSTLVLSSHAIRSEADNSDNKSTLVRHQLFYTQRLNAHLSAGAGYRYSRQSGEGTSVARYTENAFLVGLDYRF